MLRRTVSITLAFIALIVGAGFASGQEMLQFFVSFGRWGLVGAVIAGILMALTGMICLQLGSYFQAVEHRMVLERVTFPWMSKILDFFISLTLLCTGIVMFAGAGSNLQQQFHLPLWVGAVILGGLVLATGMLDVARVSAIMGAATPLIIIFLTIACTYAFIHSNESLASLEPVALQLSTNLPHWFISSMNYVGFCLMIAISMAIVMGGDNIDPRSSGLGGLLGGTIYGVFLTLCSLALFLNIRSVKDADMPMLSIVQKMNPTAGVAMAIVIYIMIYNTAIGMFYALSKRMSGGEPGRFRLWLIGSVIFAFACSFVGFKTLVAYVFPTLGYIGMALIIVLLVAWWRGRTMIRGEAERRIRIRELMTMRFDPNQHYSRTEAAEMRREIASSNLADKDLHASIVQEVHGEINKRCEEPEEESTN